MTVSMPPSGLCRKEKKKPEVGLMAEALMCRGNSQDVLGDPPGKVKVETVVVRETKQSYIGHDSTGNDLRRREKN
jgi:hypothetical protein